MKKFYIVLLAIMASVFTTKAATYYVATSGSDNNTGSMSSPFATIQKAVATCSSGNDIIYLRAGTYNQGTNISAKSGITITAYGSPSNPENVILDGSNGNANSIYIDFFLLTNGSSNITISFLHMQNLKGVNTADYYRGIYVYQADGTSAMTNLNFTDNTFQNINCDLNTYQAGTTTSNGTGSNAILVAGGNSNPAQAISNLSILRNEAYHNQTGFSEVISVKGNVNGFLIANNFVHDNANIGIDAIGLASWPVLPPNAQLCTRNGVIRNNTVVRCIDQVHDNGGIYVDGSNNMSILYNTVYDNKFGINVGCENQMSAPGGSAFNIEVRGNLMYNNRLSGLFMGTNGSGTAMGPVTNSRVSGNTFIQNGSVNYGEMFLQRLDNVTITNNVVYARSSNLGNLGGNLTNLLLDYNVYYPGTSTSTLIGGTSISTFGNVHSIFADPLLTNTSTTSPNAHLQSGSPAINAGDPAFAALVGETDFYDNTRVQGGRIDMGCSETTGSVVSVTGVSVSPTSTTIVAVTSQQLTATISPTNASNTGVTWSSSNTAVATVSSTGVVTGITAGNATITVTTVDGAKTATSSVTVTPALIISVTGVALSPTLVSIGIGGTQQLTATVAPNNATNQNITWSSNNTAVATVSGAGLVTAVAYGSATVTATTVDGSKTATCAVTVSPIYEAESSSNTLSGGALVSSASYASGGYVVGYVGNNAGTLKFNNINLSAGAYTLIISYVSGEARSAQMSINGGTATTLNFANSGSWTTVGTLSTTVILTSNSNNILFSNSSGWTPDFDRIALASTGNNVSVTSVSLSPTSASISVGGSQQLTRTITPSNATNQNVTWNTSNSSVATVNASGVVTGVGAGSATITVTTVDGGKTATCAITVTTSNVSVTGVSVSPTSASISVGGSQQLTKTISPSNATNQNVTWSTSNSSVATVNSSGLVTGVAAGSATITVTTVDGARTATSAVTVTSVVGTLPSPWASSDIGAVGAAGSASYSGTTFTLIGSGADIWDAADGFRYVYQQVTGDVTITGRLVSLTNTNGWAKAGVMIRNDLSSNAVHAMTAVTASNGLAFQRRTAAGGTSTHTAGPTGAAPYWVRLQRAGNTITSSVSTNGSTWTQVGSQSITMNSTVYVGLAVTSHADGTLCTAPIDNVTVTTTTTTPVTGVSVSPTSASLIVGGTQQLTAAVAPSNATNQAVSWSSSNAGVATVSTSGLVTAVAAGMATITVTTVDGAKTATTAVTVTASNVAVTGVSMSPTTASIAVGGTQQLTATVAPSNATNKNVTWSSSNTAVATVSTTGLITAVAAGSATITVTTTDGAKTATCAVTVTSVGGGSNITIDGSLSDWSSIPAIATKTGQTSLSLKVYDDATYLYFGISGSGLGSHYHILINSDNNSATGYQHWAFPSSGAEYHIEDGAVKLYSTYAVVAQATQSVSSTATEVRVSKSAFSSLANTITVAYVDMNSSWILTSTLGFAPYTRLSSARISDDFSDELSEISVYPNPATEVLKVNLGEGQSNINIYDVTGQLIYKKQSNQAMETIGVSELNIKGPVLLQVLKNGESSIFKVIVK